MVENTLPDQDTLLFTAQDDEQMNTMQDILMNIERDGLENGNPTEPFQAQTDEQLDPSLVWWKNVPFLYNTMLYHKLDWPSLTVDMINTNVGNRPKNTHLSSGWFNQKIIIGTCTSGQETNYLMLGEIKFPIASTFKEDPLKCENHSGFLTPKSRQRQGCPAVPNIPNFEVKGKLVHLGDVNRAVHMPQNDFLIATQAEGGKILFFDYSKHPSHPQNTRICQPQLLLRGHRDEGYGLDWSPQEKGRLASCSSDGSIAVWDISHQLSYQRPPPNFRYTTSNNGSTEQVELRESTPILEPTNTWFGDQFSSPQNDICFHPSYKSMLATCSDHGIAQLWDLRIHLEPNQSPIQTEAKSGVNCVCFNHHSSFIFATGDVDGHVYVWDMRLSKKPIVELYGHHDGITRLHFNPHYSALLGSSSQDGGLLIWDLSKKENSADFKQENSVPYHPNLRFAHRAHTPGVTDFTWSNNKFEATMISSVGWDNRISCWQMSEMAFLDFL